MLSGEDAWRRLRKTEIEMRELASGRLKIDGCVVAETRGCDFLLIVSLSDGFDVDSRSCESRKSLNEKLIFLSGVLFLCVTLRHKKIPLSNAKFR
jgi:hypothetical protein